MRLTELKQLASSGQMMRDPLISATRSIVIDAPSSKVWKILTDVTHWERWHPYLSNVVLAGPFAAGSKLMYGGFIKHDLEIARVADKELVMLFGTLASYKGITRWDITETENGKTRVTFTECSSGFLIGIFYSSEKLGNHLQDWLNALKREAERAV
jgi:uncharacterized protein YndB with AHSA1/START domain